MATILKGEGGFSFLSDSGITYSLLVGTTLGGVRQYSSDMVFIMADDADIISAADAEWDDAMVSWFFGADEFVENPDEYLDTIVDSVTRWEVKHSIFHGPKIIYVGSGCYRVEIPIGGGMVFAMYSSDIPSKKFDILYDGSASQVVDWDTIFDEENHYMTGCEGGDGMEYLYGERVLNAWKKAVELFKDKDLWN